MNFFLNSVLSPSLIAACSKFSLVPPLTFTLQDGTEIDEDSYDCFANVPLLISDSSAAEGE